MRTLNLLALVGVIYVAASWGMQWFRAPWSMAVLGPTLTGYWDGPLRARQGAEYRILLDLQYREFQGRNDTRSNLTGQARICSRHGDGHQYTLDGEATRTGDHVEIRLSPTDPARGELGNTLEGAWNGQTLTLQPRSNPFMPDGTVRPGRTLSSLDGDDLFGPAELRKSDTASFLIACARLAR